jgi:subtilisin family serine protease
MQYVTAGRRRVALLALALLLLLIGLPAAARAGIAAAGVTPDTLSLTVPLGQSDARAVTVANDADQPLALSIYEANPAVPSTQSAAPLPPELRSVVLPRQAARLDPQLAAELRAAPGQRADFLVYLSDQADLSGAYRIASWRARGEYVYQQLHAYAERSQRGLRAALDARGLSYRPLWIVNALVVRGSLADATALASRADVGLVRANHLTQLPALSTASGDARCSPDNPGNPVCWNIRQIGADRVWRDFGVTGRGIVVGSIDTGVRYSHPALAAQYRGRLPGGGYDHSYSWFDPHGVSREPYDSSGHGTHTVGTMAARGDGTPTQPSVGVAPGAQWVAAQGCYGSACSEADLIESAQWMLAPTDLDGARPRPDLRPMIVSNSWAGEGADGWYAGYVAAWRAAGIVPVFAAGNSGSACGTIASPGDYADVIAVGATDQYDLAAGFSGRGPTTDGRRKPDFMAPGAYTGGGAVGVLSTGLSDSAPYLSLQGTSMATPHVSGLIALLWSANPTLIGDYDATYAILRDTARPRSDSSCGDPAGTPNSVYGNGRIDAYAAVQRARVDVPWLSVDPPAGPIAPHTSANLNIHVDGAKVPGPGSYTARVLLYGADLTEPIATVAVAASVTPGPHPVTITGRVISAETGAPLLAEVGVRGGLPAATDSTGTYTLTLAAGSYDLVAGARSYFAADQAVALSADRRLADIALRPDYPHLTGALGGAPASLAIGQARAISITIGNQGTQPLYYSLRLPPDQFAPTRSDEPGGPAFAWVDLPPNARVLNLSDDGYAESVPLGLNFPFYSYTFTDTLVTANGLLAFSLPAFPYVGISTGCFPDSAFFFYEVAPFRADLDPSSGGTIRFGTVDQGATFVLSYENIPLHGGPPGATYTFQVLLHGDGRITYQYKRLAALPRLLAVGLQRAPLDYQDIGCGPAAALHDGLAIELRPQPSPPQWLHIADSTGTVAPGGQHTISAALSWAYPQARPLRARIVIDSNDALRSPITLPVSVEMLDTPHHYWLPIAGSARQ